MTELKNDRLLRALFRQPVDRTPVWVMRQAGRYLPEYRRIRRQAGSFMALCTNPELACEVTLQPLRRFPLDAAILFSDILTVPDAMGLGLYFEDGEGPRFRKPVRGAADVEALQVVDAAGELGLCDGGGENHTPGTERQRAADWLRRQPLDPGYLHGGGGFQQGFQESEDHGLRGRPHSCISCWACWRTR